MFSVHEILDLAIQLEKNGESVYRDAVDKVAQPDLVSLLTWMADEEASHRSWFLELKKNFETHSINPFMEEMSRQVFGAMLGEKSFSHRDVDFSRVKRLQDLIGIFIEFEKDTILFYETLIPFIEDKDTLQHISKIIAEENNHIKNLKEVLVDKAEVLLAGD
jgi:rubrerythrin